MGLKDAVFGSEGKKKEKSESGNFAWDPIKGAFQPALGYVTQGGNLVANLLGANGSGAASGAVQQFADSGGMDFLMKNMQKGVTSSKAAQGLLKSGSYGTALQDRAYGLASTYLNQYVQNALELGKLGLGAGGVMADAGRWSKSEGKGTTGKDGLLDDALKAAAASDPRLKENIEFVGTDASGLNHYTFNYKQDTRLDLPKGRFYGVMADELPPSETVVKDGYLHVTNPKYFPRKA